MQRIFDRYFNFLGSASVTPWQVTSPGILPFEICKLEPGLNKAKPGWLVESSTPEYLPRYPGTSAIASLGGFTYCALIGFRSRIPITVNTIPKSYRGLTSTFHSWTPLSSRLGWIDSNRVERLLNEKPPSINGLQIGCGLWRKMWLMPALGQQALNWPKLGSHNVSPVHLLTSILTEGWPTSFAQSAI